MISLESKTQTSTPSSPLSLTPKDDAGETTLSFSELLRGVSDKKDEKTIQNGVLVLALDEESTKDLKNTKTIKNSPLLELNPEVTKDLTPRELKVLVRDAKEYLKNKIIQSEGFKKSEIESLPKTLKGLAQVASKLGINLAKITLQELKVKTPLTQTKETTSRFISDTVDSDEGADVKLKTPDNVDIDVNMEIKKSSKKTQANLKVQSVQENINLNEKDTQEIKTQIKTELKPKELNTTPLFKAQTSKEITTEQLVNTRLNRADVNTPKKKADETLKLLLRGETKVKSESGFTADFSVATAKVLAPESVSNTSKVLESLLRGENLQNQETSKIDGLNIPKADSFEIKLNEAKQMTKYLSQDVKTAIEDYKSPFTRLKVELNPQRLGSIELTVVQRGKNLHINLSSNNAAINTLALNVNDLKVQLNNNGINNATLNFNNNSQSSEQGSFGQQQHNSQQRQEASEEYNYFQSEEQNEEILNSLEIIVPHYA